MKNRRKRGVEEVKVEGEVRMKEQEEQEGFEEVEGVETSKRRSTRNRRRRRSFIQPAGAQECRDHIRPAGGSVATKPL